MAVPFAVRTGLMVCSRWRHSACRARRRAILSGLKRPVHARICRRLPYLDARAVPARNVPSPPRLPSPAGRTGRVWDYLRLCGAKPELWEEPRRRPLAQRMALASRRRPWRGLFLRAAASAPHQGAVATSSMPTKLPWRLVRVLATMGAVLNAARRGGSLRHGIKRWLPSNCQLFNDNVAHFRISQIALNQTTLVFLKTELKHRASDHSFV